RINVLEQAMNFRRRIDRIEAHIERLRALDNRYTWARLVVFLVGIILSITLLSLKANVGWAALVITVVVFGLILRQHRKIRSTLAQFRLWRDIQTDHEARLKLDWEKLAPALPPQPDRDHPFETDLDITGNRSLHHLLDTTVALESSMRLRDRLLSTPNHVNT